MAESVLPARAPASEPVAARRRALDVPVCLSIGWLALLVGLSLVGPLLPIPDPNAQDLVSMLAPPGEAHWLGADSLGRDVFARVLYGARISLTVGLGSVAIGLLVGGGLGMVAGYYRGWSEQMVMGFMNVLLAFPALILAITIVANLGGSLLNVTLAIGTLFVPAFARIARANTLVFRRREFVLVAQALGARDPRILLREILPNLVGPILVYATLLIPSNILFEAALSFLGVGIQPPTATWGGMLSDAVNFYTLPTFMMWPGLAIFVTVLSFNLFGDGLRDALDHRAR